jgi:hypothetical protein
MPTTITPAVETVINTGSQNLFTINTVTTIPAVSGQETKFPAQAGAVYYSTVASPQTVTYSAITANVGNAITANTTSGAFSLSANVANIAYQLNGFVNVTSTPAVYGWVNTATGAAIGPTAPAGTPLSTTYVKSTANTVTVGLRVSSSSGQPFAYPTQIQAAAATVTQISGYVVA